LLQSFRASCSITFINSRKNSLAFPRSIICARYAAFTHAPTRLQINQ